MTDAQEADTKPSKKTKLKEFWRRNQALLFYFPLNLVALFVCYVVLKSLDPRIGVEGFGDLFGYLLNGVRATLILFTAWFMKRWCWFDIHRPTELSLFEEMRTGTIERSRMAYWVVVRDRAEWVAALTLATFWFTR